MGKDFAGEAQKIQSTATATATVALAARAGAGAGPLEKGSASQCPLSGQAYGLTERRNRAKLLTSQAVVKATTWSVVNLAICAVVKLANWSVARFFT